MAKNREVNFFAKISSDEEFEAFIQQKALLIMDVHLEAFGPCAISLHSTLEKAKLSLSDSSKIQLAVCNADRIEKLERFRKSCKPTILFCSRGKVVEILYGANIPRLKSMILEQLKFEEAEASGAAPRPGYDFEEYLPFELIEYESKMALELQASQAMKAKAEAELREQLDQVIELMQENAADMGVTLFFPHVVDIALKKTADIARRMFITARSRKMIQITPELMNVLNYRLENPIADEILKYILDKDLLIVVWTLDPTQKAEEILAEFTRKLVEPMLVPVENEDGSIALAEERLLEPLIVYLDEKERSIANSSGDFFELASKSSKSSNEKSTKSGSGESSLSRIDEETEAEQEERPFLLVPPVWTPTNQAGNAIFMYSFFRSLFDSFLPPVEEPEPPHICMIFPATAHKEILDVSEKFPKELLSYGFFNGNSVGDCQLICKTVEKYQELSKKPEKIFLKVAKRTSHFSLTLASMEPLYVSHNTAKGAEECAAIFNEDFQAHVDELQKKERASKAR